MALRRQAAVDIVDEHVQPSSAACLSEGGSLCDQAPLPSMARRRRRVRALPPDVRTRYVGTIGRSELAQERVNRRARARGGWNHGFVRLAGSAIVILKLATSCQSEESRSLPEPPDGMELLLTLGELEVYGEEDICTGTLNRFARHVDRLSELFAMEPPRARIFLYSDVEAARAACNGPRPGCAAWWGARAMPDNLRHEVVHVYLFAATGDTWTRAFIEEGIAQRLQGDAVGSAVDGLDDLQNLLSVHSSSDFSGADYDAAAGFFAWAVEEFGIGTVLDARSAVADAHTDEEFGSVLAGSFGFESLAELHAAYAATRAYAYPPLPNTIVTFTQDQLAAGVTFDSSCAGPYAEGPAPWPCGEPLEQVRTVGRVEVREAGEYELAPSQLHFLGCERLWLAPTTPQYEPPAQSNQFEPRLCTADEPLRFWFELAGEYEFHVFHPRDVSISTTLQLRRVDRDQCEP
jgi:hypothetical protein